MAAVVISLAVLVAATIGYAAAIPRLSLWRLDRKLRAMTPDELAAEARIYAKNAGYDKAFGDAALFQRQRDFSQTSLANALDELYAKAASKDAREATGGGPGSQVHYYYDCGLAHVRELLHESPRG